MYRELGVIFFFLSFANSIRPYFSLHNPISNIKNVDVQPQQHTMQAQCKVCAHISFFSSFDRNNKSAKSPFENVELRLSLKQVKQLNPLLSCSSFRFKFSRQQLAGFHPQLSPFQTSSLRHLLSS